MPPRRSLASGEAGPCPFGGVNRRPRALCLAARLIQRVVGGGDRGEGCVDVVFRRGAHQGACDLGEPPLGASAALRAAAVSLPDAMRRLRARVCLGCGVRPGLRGAEDRGRHACGSAVTG